MFVERYSLSDYDLVKLGLSDRTYTRLRALLRFIRSSLSRNAL